MQYFKDCIQCEFFIIGVVIAIAFIVDYVRCKSKKWGKNPYDATYKGK